MHKPKKATGSATDHLQASTFGTFWWAAQGIYWKITNPITKEIYKNSSSVNEVYRLIMTINDDWSMSAE